MIASHDSYTYLKSTNALYNLTTGPWRCQTKSIQEQLDAGVRYFDVRVVREKKGTKNLWRTCHGDAKLNYVFTSMNNICAYFETFDNVYFRLILEDGSKEDKAVFKQEVMAVKDSYSHFNWCVIKDNWETVFSKGGFNIIDYTCKMNTLGEIAGMVKYGGSILKWAKKNNPTITPEMIQDNSTVYFFDGI